VTSPEWPAINACLNLASGACLTGGYISIKKGRPQTHKRFMIAAFSCSVVFLASYLAYHFRVGSVRFAQTGSIRAIYLGLLASHTVLAMATAPLAVATLSRGLRGQVDRHRRIARVTLPIWIYVSVTGVVVYFMLYQM
jgi:uncharacterized membrane protein YozB (DUF420 family)